MLLSYLDESATKDRYYIAAVVVPEGSAAQLTADLDSVVASAAARFGIPEDTELHGHEIFAAKGPWEPFARQHRVRIGVYDEALRVIGQAPGVRLILRGMDIKKQRERYAQPDNPHSIVLLHTVERIDDHARRAGEWALVIADEVSNQNEHRRELWSFQRYGTWGYRSRRLTRIVDTMHFVPSHHSRLVQAADLVAFLHRRRETHVERDPRAERANASLWSRVAPIIEHQMRWDP